MTDYNTIVEVGSAVSIVLVIIFVLVFRRLYNKKMYRREAMTAYKMERLNIIMSRDDLIFVLNYFVGDKFEIENIHINEGVGAVVTVRFPKRTKYNQEAVEHIEEHKVSAIQMRYVYGKKRD